MQAFIGTEGAASKVRLKNSDGRLQQLTP